MTYITFTTINRSALKERPCGCSELRAKGHVLGSSENGSDVHVCYLRRPHTLLLFNCLLFIGLIMICCMHCDIPDHLYTSM